jgi:hypothetical protein
MTKIMILADTAIPPFATRQEVVDQVGEEAADAPALEPGTIIRDANIIHGVAYYKHPEFGQHYYSAEHDYEVIND